jgi:transglutaminase 1
MEVIEQYMFYSFSKWNIYTFPSLFFNLVSSDNLKIDSVELYSRDNAREHRTDRYELVRDTGRV